MPARRLKHPGFLRLRAIIRKEFLHILRDRRTLAILFIIPLTMIMLFGYAIRLDIKNIALAVWDADNTAESRELVAAFARSGYFGVTRRAITPLDAHAVFLKKEAGALLSIPKGYAKGLSRGAPLAVQFITDATDSNSATIAAQYAEVIVFQYTLDKLGAAAGNLNIESLVLFNPDLNSVHFIVPGLVAILFMMVCALLTSVTIVREKETGTMEQILVSPVRTREIIIGKVLPYVVLSLAVGIFVILLSMFWFHVPFRGKPAILAACSLIYILCALALGILISTKAKTMQVALMVALIATMLPSVMLSGFIFPIASIPRPIQGITHIVPARYYLVIIRGILLKNAGWNILKDQVLALGIYAAVLLGVSVRKFKATLE